MARRLIGSGSTFEAQIGYSRAVVDGDWIFVSGTTGFDYATMSLEDDVVAQAEKARARRQEVAHRDRGDGANPHPLMTFQTKRGIGPSWGVTSSPRSKKISST